MKSFNVSGYSSDRHSKGGHKLLTKIAAAENIDEVKNLIAEAIKGYSPNNVFYSLTGNLITQPGSSKQLCQINSDSLSFLSKSKDFISLEDIAEFDNELFLILKKHSKTESSVLPLRSQDGLIGFALINETEKGDVSSQDTVRELFNFTTLIIDKHLELNELQNNFFELESLTQISQSLATTDNLNDFYKLIQQQVFNRLGKIDILIALYDNESNTIQIPYIFEEDAVSSMDSFPLGEGLTSILLRTKQSLMLVEDTERRSLALGAKLVGKPAKSWMGIPFIVAGEAVGALIIQDTEQEYRFNNDDLEYITGLCSQVAGPLYNIRHLDLARKRALQLQTAAEIARETSTSLILDDLLQKAVLLIRNRFGYYHAAVFIADQASGYAVLREASGDAGSQMKRNGHKLEIGGQSIIGSVTKSGSALVINDTSSDPTYYPNPLLPDTRAEVGIPLKAGDRILGALDVQSSQPYSFSQEVVSILQILADQITASIINTELFSETQEHLSQHRLLHHVTTAAASSATLEDALNSAVQGLQVTLGGDLISILLKVDDHLEVKSSIGYSQDELANLRIAIGSGVTGWVAKNRKLLRINDVTKDPRFISVRTHIKSELAVPLIFRNELLGVLNVESPRANAYDEKDEELLGTLGGSLSAIIANARLLEKVRSQVDRDQLVYEITNRIRRSPNIQTVLESTVNELSKALGAQRAEIRIDLGAGKLFDTKNGKGQLSNNGEKNDQEMV